MNRILLTIILSIPMLHKVPAQSAIGLEHYQFWYREGATPVPLLYFQHRNGFYADARYNYDAPNTISLDLGYNFIKEGSVSYSVLPMAGISMGEYRGFTIRLDQEASWKRFSASSESQYCFATANNTGYFFHWSELLVEVGGPVYTGFVFQAENVDEKIFGEPGLVVGLTIGDLSFPFYLFSPFTPRSYFAAGLNYEYSFKRKKNKSKPIK